jgi:hypothetical protein
LLRPAQPQFRQSPGKPASAIGKDTRNNQQANQQKHPSE